MSLGAVQTGYVITEYAYSSKTKVQSEEFIVEVSSAMETEEGVLGIGFLREENSNYAYGMCAKYAENSSSENPVISVVVTKKGYREEYYINIKDVNPTNATDIEMFALCSYADATGKGTGGTFGSWQTLNYYRINAKNLGVFDTSNVSEAFATVKQNWVTMVSFMISEYMDAGIYKQVMDGNKLIDMFGNHAYSISENSNTLNESKIAEEVCFYGLAHNASDEVKKAFAEAANETGYSEIGKMNYISQVLITRVENTFNGTINPNDIFGSTISSALQAARQMLYELENPLTPISQRGENVAGYIEQEKEFYRVLINKLEDTSCDFSTDELNEVRYITCYTEEGIFCRKADQMEGYEWTITFENSEQYDRVIELISKFPSDWNMRFAAHENFWTDFLNDEIDIDEFMEFMEDTNKGVPDYSVTVGDSAFVDKEKAQWAKYLNPLGARFYMKDKLMFGNIEGIDDLLFSINHVPTGEIAMVYKSKKYTEDNPIYLIKGTDINGNEYEQEVNVNDINPKDCSYIEMLALSAHTGNTSPKDYLKLARMRTEAGETSYLEKTDYFAIARRLMEEMRAVGAWEDYFEYRALINDFIEYVK